MKPDATDGPFETLAALPARPRLMMLTMGRVVAQVIWALTKLGVPDQLADGPLLEAELAERTGADPRALGRMLRCAAVYQVFTETPDGEFALTPMSELLVADRPDSLRELVLMNGTDLFWRPYEGILHSARTGRPAFEEVFGDTLFGHLDTRPEAARDFHDGMLAANRRAAAVVAGLLDLSGFSRVADVGGGQGHLLAELLDRNPGCEGVLFDRPAAFADARRLLDERGLGGRVKLVAGDFFREIPAGCDAYVLKLVLHNWPDEEATRILTGVRTALGADARARVFVVERVLGEPNTLDLVRLLDMDMLVCAGGRERTLGELRALGAAAGLELAGRRAAGGLTALEYRARPAAR